MGRQAELKWNRQSKLVEILKAGYEKISLEEAEMYITEDESIL
jgi:2-oxoglutarate dehydrogenase complex dehydrogenase (E1) component-like enzyme